LKKLCPLDFPTFNPQKFSSFTTRTYLQAIGDAENPVAETVSMVKPSEWPTVTLDGRWEAEGSVLQALDARACPASDEPIEEVGKNFLHNKTYD
tara:strand:- start:242 stop:523 length:282 start_codon:yes stop_codon:yes gene_type:complete